MTAMSILMEAYVGKSKELAQCEKYMGEIIDTIYKEYDSGVMGPKLTSKRQITRNFDACKKMEKLLEKFFGVGEIKIYWDSGMINAMSVPGSSMVIASRNNKGDFSRAKFIIIIYENLVYHAGLDEKELMGVLLHEIGHCFYTSPLLICGELLGIVLNPMSLVLAFIGKPLYDLTGKLNDFTKEKLPFIHNLMDKWDNFNTEISGILRYIPSLPNPQGIAYHLVNNLTNPFRSIGRYGGERGADSFAAKYGYGEYLITGLKKLNKPEYLTGTQMVDSIGPLGDFLTDYNELVNNLVGMICLEPHPSNDARAQSMIRKLERDLQKGDYPPEVEKDLKNEINRMKKIYSELHDNQSNVEIKKAWYNMINTITHGHSDIREIFNAFYEKYEF